jgi:hypothetical protein
MNRASYAVNRVAGNPKCRFWILPHAEEKMAERDITIPDIRRALKMVM